MRRAYWRCDARRRAQIGGGGDEQTNVATAHLSQGICTFHATWESLKRRAVMRTKAHIRKPEFATIEKKLDQLGELMASVSTHVDQKFTAQQHGMTQLLVTFEAALQGLEVSCLQSASYAHAHGLTIPVNAAGVPAGSDTSRPVRSSQTDGVRTWDDVESD